MRLFISKNIMLDNILQITFVVTNTIMYNVQSHSSKGVLRQYSIMCYLEIQDHILHNILSPMHAVHACVNQPRPGWVWGVIY